MFQDDSDMKIAPEKPSKLFDSSDGAAIAFIRESQNGNMEKARVIGMQFADELTNDNGIAFFGMGEFDDKFTLEQRRIMFAYVVNKVLNDFSPNSMVAQSAVSSFNEHVREKSDKIHMLITDSAAFSLYRLSVCSDLNDSHAIGTVFARLCQREDDPLFEKYGSELAAYFIMYCTQIVLKIQMT